MGDKKGKGKSMPMRFMVTSDDLMHHGYDAVFGPGAIITSNSSTTTETLPSSPPTSVAERWSLDKIKENDREFNSSQELQAQQHYENTKVRVTFRETSSDGQGKRVEGRTTETCYTMPTTAGDEGLGLSGGCTRVENIQYVKHVEEGLISLEEPGQGPSRKQVAMDVAAGFRAEVPAVEANDLISF